MISNVRNVRPDGSRQPVGNVRLTVGNVRLTVISSAGGYIGSEYRLETMTTGRQSKIAARENDIYDRITHEFGISDECYRKKDSSMYVQSLQQAEAPSKRTKMTYRS